MYTGTLAKRLSELNTSQRAEFAKQLTSIPELEPLIQRQRLAISKALHGRIGQGSPAYKMSDDLLYTVGSEIKDPLAKLMSRLVDNITSDRCAVCYTPHGSGVTLNFDQTATDTDFIALNKTSTNDSGRTERSTLSPQ